jgi:hypothetical protein
MNDRLPSRVGEAPSLAEIVRAERRIGTVDFTGPLTDPDTGAERPAPEGPFGPGGVAFDDMAPVVPIAPIDRLAAEVSAARGPRREALETAHRRYDEAARLEAQALAATLAAERALSEADATAEDVADDDTDTDTSVHEGAVHEGAEDLGGLVLLDDEDDEDDDVLVHLDDDEDDVDLEELDRRLRIHAGEPLAGGAAAGLASEETIAAIDAIDDDDIELMPSQSVKRVADDVIAAMRRVQDAYEAHVAALETEAARRYELLTAQAELDAELIRLNARREAHTIVAAARVRSDQTDFDLIETEQLGEIGETFSRFAEEIEAQAAQGREGPDDLDEV